MARTRPGTAGHGATVPAGKATTALPAATMVYLPPLPGRRRAHAGAMPASGTVLARVVHLRCRAPIGCGQQRSRAEPASAGGEPEDQRGHPFGPGKRYQEHLDFFVRRLAPARTQPLPRPTVRPLQAPTCPTLNTYADPQFPCRNEGRLLAPAAGVVPLRGNRTPEFRRAARRNRSQEWR